MDRALTMALLDQHYGWSTGLAELNPPERIAVRAMFDGDVAVDGDGHRRPGCRPTARTGRSGHRDSPPITPRTPSAHPGTRSTPSAPPAASPKLFDGADDLAGRDATAAARTCAATRRSSTAARGLDDRPDDLGGGLAEHPWDAVLVLRARRPVDAATRPSRLGCRPGLGRRRGRGHRDGERRVRGRHDRHRPTRPAGCDCSTHCAMGGGRSGRRRNDGHRDRHRTDLGLLVRPGSGADTVLNDQIRPSVRSVVSCTAIGDLGATDGRRAGLRGERGACLRRRRRSSQPATTWRSPPS